MSTPTPASPSIGLAVAHLFWKVGPGVDVEALRAAVDAARSDGDQVVTASLLGHRADLCTMILSTDQWRIRGMQTRLAAAGLALADSYISLTELSEYAQGVPEELKQARLYPDLPPEGKPAFCFYPMSKRRDPGANWYSETFDRRKELMYEHGASGRKFAGRVLQLITGSTGLDSHEWGVTLFCEHPDDVKAVVYTLRFDTASAVYADFGTFYVGMVADLDECLTSVGC